MDKYVHSEHGQDGIEWEIVSEERTYQEEDGYDPYNSLPPEKDLWARHYWH